MIVARKHQYVSVMSTLSMIRRAGCKEDIQLWALESEARIFDQQSLDAFGAALFVFEHYVDEKIMASLHNSVGTVMFKLKPLAMIHSGFARVLLIEADTTPVTDITSLFDDSMTALTPALFWPTFHVPHPGQTCAIYMFIYYFFEIIFVKYVYITDGDAWRVFDQAPSQQWQQSSRVMLVNTRTSWEALHLRLTFPLIAVRLCEHKYLLTSSISVCFCWMMSTPRCLTATQTSCGMPWYLLCFETM